MWDDQQMPGAIALTVSPAESHSRGAYGAPSSCGLNVPTWLSRILVASVFLLEAGAQAKARCIVQRASRGFGTDPVLRGTAFPSRGAA